MFRVKIVYHLRGKGIKEAAKQGWKNLLYRYAFCGEDVICLSHLLTYDVEDVFWGKIHIVNNGIPDIEEKYRKGQDQGSNRIPKILFISNLFRSKGIGDFLRSLALLKARDVSFQGIIVGAEGDIRIQKLFQEIKTLDLFDKVQYLGEKYDTEKFKILAQADIIVFPTKMAHETFGNINLEAMQFGKPIISTNIAAIPDIIDDAVTGFLVDRNSPGQIAEKLEILINDRVLRESMGRAGRKKFEERYTLERFERTLLSVFNEVLNEAP